MKALAVVCCVGALAYTMALDPMYTLAVAMPCWMVGTMEGPMCTLVEALACLRACKPEDQASDKLVLKMLASNTMASLECARYGPVHYKRVRLKSDTRELEDPMCILVEALALSRMA